MAERWVESLLLESMGLQAGERLLIMVDPPLQGAAEVLAAAARGWGAARVELQPLPGAGNRFTLISTRFVQAVREADLLISLRAGLDLQAEDPHIRAAMDAFRQAKRGRWASLAQVDLAALQQGLRGGPGPIQEQAERLAAELRQARGLRLTTPLGTDLQIIYGERPIHLETGLIRQPGLIGNLPAGEVYVAPVESGAEGRLVVDLCIGDLRLDQPVTLHFAGGQVVEVVGGWAASELRARLGTDRWAWTIGELGLGANPFLRPSGRVAIDEKVLGTAHVALGGNRSFGGQNPATTHYDAVVADVSLAYLT